MSETAEASCPVVEADEQFDQQSMARASTAVLSSIFVLTGVGTALLGSALPAILSHWSLSDRDGGYLFLLAWLGASLGAALSRGNTVHSLARGLLLLTACCFLLLRAGSHQVFPLIFGYGVGLGIAMTSISLLRSQRSGERRSREMNRLNMLWALGALACPSLARHALHTSRVGYLFATIGSIFALSCLWVLAVELKFPSGQQPMPQRASARDASLPILLGIFSAFIVGVESAMGGWMTTYARRLDHSVAAAVTATSAFWAGLLLSRALHSLPAMARISSAATLRTHLWLTAVSACVLSIMVSPAWLLAAAFGVGAGLGPLYPTLLTLVLPRYRGTRVFLLAGLGSAAFPWMTGWVSTQTGSLREGLLVPTGAACLLVAMMWAVLRTLQSPAPPARS